MRDPALCGNALYSGDLYCNKSKLRVFMSKAQELNIDHEVRIRILEDIASKIDHKLHKMEQNIDAKFMHLDSKMDTQFHWVLGTILTLIATIITVFGGIILHMAKLI